MIWLLIAIAPAGATNPAVTQANIGETICVMGWTKTIRPPRSYTSRLKRMQIREQGLPGRMSDYEEDHLIPLELGGNPTDERNLWPQPIDQAIAKDRQERQLNREVCRHRMSLRAAQAAILRSAR